MTAAQLKLDELIRSLQGAHNVFLNLEDLGEEDLERIRERYSELAARARQDSRREPMGTNQAKAAVVIRMVGLTDAGPPTSTR